MYFLVLSFYLIIIIQESKGNDAWWLYLRLVWTDGYAYLMRIFNWLIFYGYYCVIQVSKGSGDMIFITHSPYMLMDVIRSIYLIAILCVITALFEGRAEVTYVAYTASFVYG